MFADVGCVELYLVRNTTKRNAPAMAPELSPLERKSKQVDEAIVKNVYQVLVTPTQHLLLYSTVRTLVEVATTCFQHALREAQWREHAKASELPWC